MSSTTYLRRRAAAEYLREQRGIPCSEKTLAKLACIGGGPIYRRFGRIPLYLIADLDVYAEAKLSKPIRSAIASAAVNNSGSSSPSQIAPANRSAAPGGTSRRGSLAASPCARPPNTGADDEP